MSLPAFMVQGDSSRPPELRVAAPPRQQFAPGVFHDMPGEVYHAIEAMSASGAKKMLRSPRHYRLMRETPNEPTAAMQFGSVVHAGVLEPETLESCVAVLPEVNRRTNAGKAMIADFEALNPGRILLDAAEYARALACIKAVHAHRGASTLLDGGEREVSLFWNDGRYGVPCKARLDIRSHGGITDLKTTQDASPEGFAKQISNLLYHVQGAFYCSASEHALNESPRFFAFIAVESEPPHAVACYALPSNAILAGLHLVNRALERYAAALAAGEWPGYPDTIDMIKLPPYALRFDN